MNAVQMINDNYDIRKNEYVQLLYPTLYKEVCEHDSKYSSSWYSLSDDAFEEYEKYKNNNEIGYIR